jgi:bifunctional non-homologous end joining protein LigD
MLGAMARAKVSVRKAPRPPKRTEARADRFPHVDQPELATLIDAPFDDDEWLFEIKWDGFRALTTIHEDGRLEMVSRNGKDFLARFPELEPLAGNFTGAPLLVDGEIVALDAKGDSSFQLLQNRSGGEHPRVRYVVFDCLYAEGRDLRAEPLEARKEVLARVLRPSATEAVYSTHVVGKGKGLFADAQARGLEGIVAKRRSSPYLEKRTRDWLKIKAQLEQECVIAGYTAPGGAREGFGALILGVYEKGQLVYCGNVGTGFDVATIRSLLSKLRPLGTSASPFGVAPKTRTAAQWVRPELVAQVRFTEWTNDGSMRHPVFLGLRDDKAATDVHRERPRPGASPAAR